MTSKHRMSELPVTSSRRIEFIGLPGSGKTFLLKRLLKRYQSDLMLVHFKDRVGERRLTGLAATLLPRLRWLLPATAYRRRLRRAYKVPKKSVDIPALLAFAVEHDLLLGFLLRELSTSGVAARDKVLVLDWFMRLFADFRLAQGANGRQEWLLFDESFAQKAVSLVLHLQFGADQVREYVSRVPRPDAAVVCDVSDAVVARRLGARGWPGWVDRDEIDDRELLKRCRVGVETAAAEYEGHGVPIVRVDNDRDGARAADQVVDALSMDLRHALRR